MSTVFEKLNLKTQADILILNAPESFEKEIATLKKVTVHRAVSELKQLEFALAFVTRQSEVDKLAAQLTKRAEGDAILWFAYPKGTSKKYKCDFNRDTGWAALEAAGFTTVRAVAIDEDWTALRFRRVEFVKTASRA